MKKTELINSELSYAIAKMGHKQKICIGDAGLPIPLGIKRIDLALTYGVPTFLDTVDVVLKEMVVEKIILAEELKENHPEMLEQILSRFSDVEVCLVAHDKFKTIVSSCEAVVRTGETITFSNIILVAGVVF